MKSRADHEGAPAARSHVGFVEMIRHANAPLPPEHSVTFRIATAVAVLTGIIALSLIHI